MSEPTPRKRVRRQGKVSRARPRPQKQKDATRPDVEPTERQKKWAENKGKWEEKQRLKRTGEDEFAEVDTSDILSPKDRMSASSALGIGGKTKRAKDGGAVEVTLKDAININDVPVAKEADSGEDLYEDQRVAQCEYMMLRGIEDPYAIKNTLGFRDVRVAKTFIKRVKMRWALAGSEDKNRMEVARLTAVRKLQLLQQKLWTMIDDGYNGKALTTSERLKAMEGIEKLVMRVAEVEGVTKDTIVSIIQQSLSIGGDGAFHKAIDKNDMMKKMATRFEQLLSEKQIN